MVGAGGLGAKCGYFYIALAQMKPGVKDSRNVRPGQGRAGFLRAFRALTRTAIHVLPLRGQNNVKMRSGAVGFHFAI